MEKTAEVNRDNRGIFERFYHDDRAVEGLPVRLFIALVVGIAALSLMTGILSGIPTIDRTEVTVEANDGEPALVEYVGRTVQSLDLSVVTQNGEPVQGTQLVIEGKNVALESGPQVIPTGPRSNTANVSITDEQSDGNADITTDLRADQDRAKLEVTVEPPSDSDYVDNQANPDITVVA